MSETSIPPAILDEAAAWLVRLHGDECSEADRQACAQWRLRSQQHARAWERAERLLLRLGSLPPELAMPALGRERGLDRRRALKQLAVLLGAAPLAWGAWREKPWQEWLADQRTTVGELRELTLLDGSRLTLNTATAVDLRFDADQRLVRLLQGELLVETASDPSSPPRPFLVATAEGRLRALGTRFGVRQDDGHTHLSVLQGAVEVSPLQGARRVIEAGRGGEFRATGFSALTPVDAGSVAWTRGMLMADRMPLGEFAAELARYRRGVVRCDPAVTSLPVSGAYPIRDRARTLAMLQATYPIRVEAVTDYWITLGPA
ncbi:FecR domain-containing protein [Zestomonas carbonaria]|uniref:Protein FecR n=1 Tax=Zestomonas carbonaria TaxID=2762745 RepID=A0A7U7ELR4_9GAMM|nr:FecR domain-containing protein [Pseudomonas carbonaria]CAD5107295.1 Protein FecR [Pseudomonas carbonaria]